MIKESSPLLPNNRQLLLVEDLEYRIIQGLLKRYGSIISNIIKETYHGYGQPHKILKTNTEGKRKKWFLQQIHLSRLRQKLILLDIIQVYGSDAFLTAKSIIEHHGFLAGKEAKKNSNNPINASDIYQWIHLLSPCLICFPTGNKIVRMTQDYILWYCYSRYNDVNLGHTDWAILNVLHQLQSIWNTGFCRGINQEFGFSSKVVSFHSGGQYKNRIYKKKLLV